MNPRRKQLSKSAPAGRRVGEKDVDKKVSTIREINAWIHKGNNDQKNRRTARNTGLLTENVTEERLLYARQMELGRERYKFLNQHAYEKQKFIERQKKKYQSIKKMRHTALLPMDVGRMEAARRVTSSSGSPMAVNTVIGLPELEVTVTDDTIERGESTITGTVPRRSSHKGRPRFYSEKTGKVSDLSEGVHDSKDVHLPKTVKINTTPRLLGRSVYMNTSNETLDSVHTGGKKDQHAATTTVERLPNVKLESRTSDKFLTVHSAIPKTQETLTSNRRLSLMHSAFCLTNKSPDESDMATRRDSTWMKRRNSQFPRFGEKFASSIQDPRYVALKHALAPSVEPAIILPDVHDIIEGNEILKTGSRRMHDVNEKLVQQRFLAYILENELAIK